ncbi:alanine racemase [Nitrospira sp. Nam74]
MSNPPFPQSPSYADSVEPSSVAIIDLSALGHNLDQVRQRIPKGCDILAVVKADAYGHGDAAIASALAGMGVRRFGVATVEEGIQLRQSGLPHPILVMGALRPEHNAAVIGHRLTPIIHDRHIAEQFAKEVPSAARPYPVHVKVDTGMGRLGLCHNDVLPFLQSSPFPETLLAEGFMTHLADADSEDPAFTTLQIELFRTLIDRLKASGIHIPLIHAANSAAILLHPSAHFTMVRPGIMLYGYHTVTHFNSPPDLRPILSLVTRVVQVRAIAPGESVSYNRVFTACRPSRIAVLRIGYADGYSRLLSDRGAVLIRGRRAPIVGRICMDMTMVDVTDIPNVVAGDEAVLIGQQAGLRITAAHLAAWSQTIPYEVLCAIGPRVRRVYR